MRKLQLFIYSLILFIIFYGIKHYGHINEASIQAEFYRENYKKLILTRSEIERHFEHIYLGLRSISVSLNSPSEVKYRKELYESLYANLEQKTKISEMYYTPVSTDFNQWDDLTKLPRGIVKFENEQHHEHEEKAHKSDHDNSEVEIYEMNDIKKQLSFFKEKFPKSNTFKELDYPATSGDELITCDNTKSESPHFDKIRTDDRLGIIYSIPTYDKRGELHGILSAVIKIDSLIKIFDGPFFTLTRPDSSFNLDLTKLGQWSKKEEQYFFYTDKVNIHDNRPWHLEMKIPMTIYQKSPFYKEIKRGEHIKIVFAVGISILFVITFFLRSGIEQQRDLNKELQEEIEKRRQSEERLAQFTSDASHELRSPLAAIRGEAEVALRKDRQAQEYKETIQQNLESAIELQEILDHLMMLARFDKNKASENLESLHVKSIFDELKSIYQTQLEDRFHFEGDNINFLGHEKSLYMAFKNIIENAIKYAGPQCQLTMTCKKSNGTIIFSFVDNGQGMSEEVLSKAIDRFYRDDKTKHLAKGFGLGLSLVHKIAKSHDGNLVLKNSTPKGLIVELTIRDYLHSQS